MFHKIKDVTPLPGLRLRVLFANGTTKLYDATPLTERFAAFQELKSGHLFEDVEVDAGGYGISWNDDLDLSCDEIWEHGEPITTEFDGLMSFADASDLWGLSESTLRKAVSYGKIVAGVGIHAPKGGLIRKNRRRRRREEVRQAVGRHFRRHVQGVRGAAERLGAFNLPADERPGAEKDPRPRLARLTDGGFFSADCSARG